MSPLLLSKPSRRGRQQVSSEGPRPTPSDPALVKRATAPVAERSEQNAGRGRDRGDVQSMRRYDTKQTILIVLLIERSPVLSRSPGRVLGRLGGGHQEWPVGKLALPEQRWREGLREQLLGPRDDIAVECSLRVCHLVQPVQTVAATPSKLTGRQGQWDSYPFPHVLLQGSSARH